MLLQIKNKFRYVYDPVVVHSDRISLIGTSELIFSNSLHMLYEGKTVYLYTNSKGQGDSEIKFAEIIHANEFSYAEYEFRFNVEDKFLLELKITLKDYESRNFEIIRKGVLCRLGDIYISTKKSVLEEYITKQKKLKSILETESKKDELEQQGGFTPLEDGEVALIMSHKNRICQIALTKEQHSTLQLFAAGLSADKPLTVLPPEYDVTIKQ